MNGYKNVFIRIAVILPILFLLLLSGCAGGNYSSSGENDFPAPDDEQGWSKHFPHEQYISAWGISNQSARQAENDAKAMVAAAVRSSIESELISVMESETWNSGSTDYQKLESRTKISAHFDHAELIRPVPATAHHHHNEFKVLAVLSRREAARELLIPYETEAADFRLLATRLDSLQNDYPRFTTTWNKLKIQHEKMLAPAAEVRAVSGMQPAQISRDESQWKIASASRMNLLSKVEVVVELAPNEELNNEELAGKVHTALASMGLHTSSGGCRPDAVLLKLNPELQWHQVLGRVAQLDLVGEVGPCNSPTPWNSFQISDRQMRGEGRNPLGDLMERLKPDFLAEQFTEIMQYYLPF